MLKVTNENNLKEKLTYLNLDLENIPQFLLKYESLDYRVTNGIEDLEQQVYKYVPVDKIQILVTPNTKNADLRKKYSESLPLYRYLNSENNDDIDRYTIFLTMLNNMSMEEVTAIEKKQEKLLDTIPFRIKYEKSYLWQIYYSYVTDKYFMMVSTEDLEYNNMFYILKKQIEFSNSKSKTAPKVYVPINHLEYSRDLVNKSEIKDIENYLWLLTGDWVKTYEVYDKKNNPTIHIIGETKVYDDIKTEYKIKIENKEDAKSIYKLLKALFIIKTELNHLYKFDIRIDNESKLEFYYNLEPLTLETLPTFIKREYKKISDELVRKNLASNHLEQVLGSMKKDCYEKEIEFIEKEKQISTFLEYRKTFFGKIKIFFSNKKRNNAQKERVFQKNELVVNSLDVINELIQKKSNYTIEDLVIIYAAYDKKAKHVKDLDMDIEALEHKLKNLERKLDNARLFIKEIEKHKKSIFDFWRFANKDELPALMEGEKSSYKKKLHKMFNYEFDFEDLGNKADKKQRECLSKEEINSIFLSKTNILAGINIIRKDELDNGDEKELKRLLDVLKKELKNDTTGEIGFDIFGAILDDRTQIKTIANKHHREIEKNKLQILNISKDTKLEEFIESLKNIDLNLQNAIKKVKFSYSMPVYKVTENELSNTSLEIFSIGSENAIKNNESKEVNLYKVNLKEGQEAVFYTNIIFYENNNKTLPIGMNLSNDILLDMTNLNLKLIEKKTFYTNLYFKNDDNASKLKITKVNVFEYET